MPPAGSVSRTLRFFSRGDRVAARLWLPAPGAAPAPCVLLPRAGRRELQEPLEASARDWAQRGAAVASIDLPLFGERRSAKLSELLSQALSGRIASGESALLVAEFLSQSLADLARALDALSRAPEVDASRSAVVGFELGGTVGALWCGDEPRLRAAALSLDGACPALAAFEPEAALRRFAPRPLLRHGGSPLESAASIWSFLQPALEVAPRS